MEFKVIKGGKAKDIESEYKFLDGTATDTRLMGVMGLHLSYLKDIKDIGCINIHYFLYYDIEEIGLDYVKTLQSDNQEEILTTEKSYFGGLGANIVHITEKECLYLVNQFIEGTKKKGKILPKNISDIQFILDILSQEAQFLNPAELESLNKKICTPVSNDFGLINYYIMRCIGKDYEGARLVCDNTLNEERYEDLSFKHHGTFLQNSIEIFFDEDGEKSYLCQSLIDTDNRYMLLQSELKTDNKRVVSAKKRFVMPISIEEASLMLSTSEFVTVYEILDDDLGVGNLVPECFDDSFSLYSLGFTKTRHESGTMYMQFFDNNLHVEKAEFNLADDVKAIYFVTDYGQLIVGAYSLEEIEAAEYALDNSEVDYFIEATNKYQFSQSIVYEFALSGMCDFEEFVKMNE